MKMKSKALLAALCAVLLVCATMFGTLAYLTDTTETVKNTFTVGNLFDPDDPDDTPEDGPFVLKEHKTKDSDTDGIADDFDMDADELAEQGYTAIPGVTLPKDPFVRSDVKFALEAYVFVEVCNNTAVKDKDDKVVTDEEGNVLYHVTFEVDDSLWNPLMDGNDDPILGEHGGQIYVLKEKAAAGEVLEPQNIIKNKKVTVSENVTEGAELGTLNFYGYACQAAGFDDAADAWAGAFGTSGESGATE